VRKGTRLVIAVLKLQRGCSWAILSLCWRASGVVNNLWSQCLLYVSLE